jgi:hypothetical protein
MLLDSADAHAVAGGLQHVSGIARDIGTVIMGALGELHQLSLKLITLWRIFLVVDMPLVVVRRGQCVAASAS